MLELVNIGWQHLDGLTVWLSDSTPGRVGIGSERKPVSPFVAIMRPPSHWHLSPTRPSSLFVRDALLSTVYSYLC